MAAWEREARNAGDSSAEAMALARLRAGWGSVAVASAGGMSLSNRADRAQIIPLPGGGGGSPNNSHNCSNIAQLVDIELKSELNLLLEIHNYLEFFPYFLKY